jgi:hypothetical protein
MKNRENTSPILGEAPGRPWGIFLVPVCEVKMWRLAECDLAVHCAFRVKRENRGWRRNSFSNLDILFSLLM